MARMLEKRMPVSGVILFGDSLPISETSHGIVGAATALPMEAMAAAYHGMAATHGLDASAFLRKSYDFAIDSFLPALARGQALPAARARLIAQELSGFTGIAARYYLAHRLVAPRPLTMDTRDLTPAQLRPQEGRSPAPGLSTPEKPEKPEKPKTQSLPKSLRALTAVLSRYMRSQLHASFPGLAYRLTAPHSFARVPRPRRDSPVPGLRMNGGERQAADAAADSTAAQPQTCSNTRRAFSPRIPRICSSA